MRRPKLEVVAALFECLGREVGRETLVGGLLPHRHLEKAPLLARDVRLHMGGRFRGVVRTEPQQCHPTTTVFKTAS